MRLAFACLALFAAAAGAAAVSAQQPGPPKLDFPLACVIGKSCQVQHYVDRDPGPGVRDYRCGPHSYDKHNGVDIRLLDLAEQRAGVNVLAAAPGRVARLRDGVADISIRAPGAPPVAGRECGNGVVIDHGGGWESQYCHLARGSIVVRPGQPVTAGQPLGKVGLSGDTEFPHMHITIRHGGQVVDPFAPSPAQNCRPQTPLWSQAALRQMPYQRGSVLNAGFAGGPVANETVEAGGIARPSQASPYLVAYVRAIELEAGDRIELTLAGPDGRSLAAGQIPPLDHKKAQYLYYVGKKRPATGWARGVYRAQYRVLRGSAVVIDHHFQLAL